jgi:Cdc6-like AAA superfamily ATPase
MSNSDQKNEIDYEAINILLMSYDLNPYIGLNDNDYKRLIVVIDNIDNLKAEYKKIADEIFEVFRANLSINHSNF